MKNCKCSSCKCKPGPDYFQEISEEYNKPRVSSNLFATTSFLLLVFLVIALALSSCSASRVITYQDQDIPELNELPVGTSFALFDTEGKATVVSKIGPSSYSIDAEKPPERQQGSFINIQVHKDKSTTQTADNGAVIADKNKAKDKSRTETNSRNRQKEKTTNNSLPWYVYLILAAAVVGFLYWKFIIPKVRM